MEIDDLRMRLIKERAAHEFDVRNFPKRLAEQSAEIVQAEEGVAAEALGFTGGRPAASPGKCCCGPEKWCGDDCKGCPVHGPICQVDGEHETKQDGIYNVCSKCFKKLVKGRSNPVQPEIAKCEKCSKGVHSLCAKDSCACKSMMHPKEERLIIPTCPTCGGLMEVAPGIEVWCEKCNPILPLGKVRPEVPK